MVVYIILLFLQTLGGNTSSVTDCCDNQMITIMSSYVSTQSAEKLLQDMMREYCEQYVYPDMEKLREVLTKLSDQQKFTLTTAGVLTLAYTTVLRSIQGSHRDN